MQGRHISLSIREHAWLVLLLVVATLIVSPSQHARAHSGSTYYPLRWEGNPNLNFRFRSAFFDLPTSYRDRIRDGAREWNDIDRAIKFSYQPEPLNHSVGSCRDAALQAGTQNGIHWIDFGGGSPLAQADACRLNNTGAYVTFQMAFNKDINWYTGTGAPGPTQIDLWGVATHEFGHVTGFGHGIAPDHFSDADPDCFDTLTRSTMCSGSFPGNKTKRTPEGHDIHTFASIYGGTNSYCGIVVYGEMQTKFLALGGGNTSVWPGCPVGSEQDELLSSRKQRFALGSSSTYLYDHPVTGTHEVHGSILAKYLSPGEVGGLGLPSTDEKPATGGGRYAHFYGLGSSTCSTSAPSSASIFWRSDLGANAVLGSIRTKWCSLGWENGILGYPTSDEMNASGTTANPNGRESRFEGGRIWWSSSTGSHEVHGPILTTYLNSGGPSTFGFPKTDVYVPSPGQQRSDFENASMIYDESLGQTVICPAPCAV